MRCIWRALHTLHVQDVVTERLQELSTGRLVLWTDRLGTAMRETGKNDLAINYNEKDFLKKTLNPLYRVRWARVHLAWSTRALGNDFRSPILQFSDILPYNAACRYLGWFGELRRPLPFFARDSICRPELNQLWVSRSVNRSVTLSFWKSSNRRMLVDLMQLDTAPWRGGVLEFWLLTIGCTKALIFPSKK